MDNKTALAVAKRTPASARLVLVLAATALSVTAGTEPDQLIRQVQDRYNSAKTLSVHFRENYSLLGHPRSPESGMLTLRKEGKMRWDYDRPKGKVFVSDGKNVYLYTATDNRVEKVPLRDTEDMRAPLAFLLGRLDLKKEFQNFELKPGEGGTWLDAFAKTDRVPYKEVQMLIAPDSSIRQLNVLGRDESVLSYLFTDERINPAVNDSLFHFTIPAGAEVVDSLEYRSSEK
ncbi:MAG: outer membrane lipoprotein carrier protein LolA [Acidobacteriaceae bacterium]|nr:outer membrane lipoprotein carrier protein LolA [Acidobacteriaceae bacterium]